MPGVPEANFELAKEMGSPNWSITKNGDERTISKDEAAAIMALAINEGEPFEQNPDLHQDLYAIAEAAFERMPSTHRVIP